MHKKPRVVVSACLLGELCRYDGATKEDRELMAWLEDKEVISFCPEAPVLGTPRPRINVFKYESGYRVIRESDAADVTALIEAQTTKLLKEARDIDLVILKSKSPSCGSGTTPILDKDGKQIALGDGIAALQLKKHVAKIYDETNYKEYIC